MVSFANFTPEGEGPIYLKIVRFVMAGVAAETITDGEEMPSRRVLSALLGVNPNTVQKAYRMLEDEGLVVSRSGAKSFVSVTPELMEALRGRLQREEISKVLRSLRSGGMEKAEALELFGRLWDEAEDEACEEGEGEI